MSRIPLDEDREDPDHHDPRYFPDGAVPRLDEGGEGEDDESPRGEDERQDEQTCSSCLARFASAAGEHSVLANQFQQDLAGDSDEQDSDEHPQRPAPTDEDRHDREHHGHADRKRDGARKDPLSAGRFLLLDGHDFLTLARQRRHARG